MSQVAERALTIDLAMARYKQGGCPSCGKKFGEPRGLEYRDKSSDLYCHTCIVLLGSISGTYVGHIYGPGVDPDDFRELFAIDSTIHLAAAAGGIIVATTVGLLSQVRTPNRIKSRVLSMPLKFRD